MYNRKLVNRGRIITLLLEPSLLDHDFTDDINHGKRGRPFIFSTALVKAALAVKCALHLAYRQLEGFVEDVCRRLKMRVPNFRTIWWRFDKSAPEPVKRLTPQNNRAIIAIDSTGLRPVNDGEYRAMKYDKRREWIKMHAAFDVDTKEFVNVSITKGNVNDSLKFTETIKPVKAAQILADKGYDTVEVFEFCKKMGITPKIPVKLNATNGGSRSSARRDAITDQLGFQIRPGWYGFNIHLNKEMKSENQKKWKTRVGYGKRSLIESSFSTYKRIFGECLFSKKMCNIRKEIVTKLNLYNLFSVSW
jgi:hypothetical protein